MDAEKGFLEESLAMLDDDMLAEFVGAKDMLFEWLVDRFCTPVV